jgi:hypothetical protein
VSQRCPSHSQARGGGRVGWPHQLKGILCIAAKKGPNFLLCRPIGPSAGVHAALGRSPIRSSDAQMRRPPSHCPHQHRATCLVWGWGIGFGVEGCSPKRAGRGCRRATTSHVSVHLQEGSTSDAESPEVELRLLRAAAEEAVDSHDPAALCADRAHWLYFAVPLEPVAGAKMALYFNKNVSEQLRWAFLGSHRGSGQIAGMKSIFCA